jgi:vacuolar-type H+-ATPase subunit C/Vma6|tara:strand:- start:2289 stop:2669 length:381 start_codon:yes stop_codon:yes gene_type:complete
MSRKLDNISFSLQETSKESNGKKYITYDDLLENVNLMEMTNSVMMDDYLALEIEYQTNYIKKELDRIADYYNIVKRKKKKDRLVEEIVIFEKDPDNMETVFRRKRMWSYVEEIKNDKYLSKFLILD